MAAGRAKSLLVPAFLTLLSVLQAPGRITFDTDLGLALDPGHLMARSVHLWSAENGFGGVGDQTYGFLFPMGPFFWVLERVGLPVWLVQRLWCALVLVVAYEGARQLVRRLVAADEPVAVVAGLAWALSPRMLTVVGPFSSEALPLAVLPWVLLPLARYGAEDRRRAGLLSGVAVLGLGAVNATATLAVLPVPLLYLLTRPWPARERLRALAWWGGAVVLATAWWVGPLLFLGAYSPPFTDWVESAATTTGQVGALNTLRGATDWVAFVPSGGHGFWPGGWMLAVSAPLVVLTTVVGVLGLAGLASRHVPERRWLILTALLGFAVLTAGHAGRVGSPLDATVRSLLDGPLVPFRNIYKFDGVLRLPLLLGFAHLLVRLRTAELPSLRRLTPLVAGALVLGVAAPAFAGELRPGPGFSAVPSWWEQAADAMAATPGRTLVLPEATAGRYTWGRTIGEPLEALAHSPWAVRNQVPLTLAGNTRVVDAVEQALATGRGSPVLAAVLARSGVSQVLVRNDLDRSTADTLPPVRVRAALEASPGMTLVRSFGPVQEPRRALFGTLDGGIDTAPQALDLWRVEPVAAGPHAVDLDDVVTLDGGPEDLLPLLESGAVAADQPTVLTSQLAGQRTGEQALSDGLQRRERSFGDVQHALGPVLTKGEPFRQQRAAHDLLPVPGAPLTVAAYDGLVSVTASSSAAYPDTFGGADPSAQPASAIDGSATTYWRSAPLTRPQGQWLQVVRRSPSDARSVSVQLVVNGLFGPRVAKVAVQTDSGSLTQSVEATEQPQLLKVPPGSWTRLRLVVAEVPGSPRFGEVGVRELTLPGPDPVRTLVVPPSLKGSAPPRLAFQTSEPVEPCLVLGATTRCDAGSATPAEDRAIDRSFTLPAGGSYAVSGTALPSLGGSSLIPTASGETATASSSLDNGLLTGAENLLDGTPSAWIAGTLDTRPSVTLTWPAPQTLTQLRLAFTTTPAASRPRQVHLFSPDGTRDASVAADGTLSFAPLTTTTVTLTFPRVDVVKDLSSRTGFVTSLPVGLAEIAPSASTPPSDDTAVALPCGQGPTVTVDGTEHASRVATTVGDVRRSRPIAWTLCDGISLTSGTHRVRVVGNARLAVRTAALTQPAVTAQTRSVDVTTWGQVHRRVAVGAGDAALLVVPEAQSTGWVATLRSRRLPAVTVDGWQQAWVVPAGAGGTVDLRFAPDRSYQAALVVGAGLAVLLLAGAALAWERPRRRPVTATARSVHPALAIAGAAVLTFGLGGPVALAGLVAGALAVGRRRRSWVALAAAGLAGAGGLVAVALGTPVVAGQNNAVVQALVLLAVGGLASLALPQAELGEELVLPRVVLPRPSLRPRRPAVPVPAPLAVRRLREAALCFGLVVLAFHQSPGLISNDTKLDLTVDPGRFLRRALDLWNPAAGFGQLQNQAYGYLWPMGPFHWLGLELGITPWAVQRLWMGLLLVVAYLGTVRLAARLGLGDEVTRVLAGLSYALAPRVLTEIGGNSSEILPMAVLPWVLLPLVGATRPRRAAMRSGVAVLCMGAVNAAAVLAVLVLPAVWLLPGLRDRAGRRLAGWWAVAVVLATGWWVGPLLLQGRYASDFLDYIETASTTTGTTSVSEVLRGTSHWLAYVQSGGEPWWHAGWTLVTNGGVILNTAVLVALALLGLTRRGMPGQRRLLLVAGVGLVAMSAAHAGPVQGPFVDDLRQALDGPLAPFRNVHKFAPLLALPLALGLAFLLTRAHKAVVLLTLVVLAGTAVPALAGQVVPAGGYAKMPSWWKQTGSWLDQHDATGRALVVPNRSFGEYQWGRPLDDPLQALTRTEWAVRDSVPLGSAGNTRLLDALGQRLDAGVGSPGIAQVLRRLGVKYLVVANDLDQRLAGTPRPVLVHQALMDSPGLEQVAAFGPAVGDSGEARNVLLDSGLAPPFRAAEVYEVAGDVDRITSLPTAGQELLTGGPEALFQLADRGLLDGTAVQLAGDGTDGRSVLTDAMRRREVSFGSVRGNSTPTLTATQPLRHRQPVPDELPLPGSRHLATARYVGGLPTASSSSADPGSLVLVGPASRPFSAFDGDPSTAWVSGSLRGAAGQWVQVDLDAPVDPAGMTIEQLTTDLRVGHVTQVRVTTDRGSVLSSTDGTIRTPAGTTRRVRITVTQVAHDGFGVVAGFTEVHLPGVQLTETTVLAHDQRTGADPVVLLDRVPGARGDCVRTSATVACSPVLARQGEDAVSLDRSFQLDTATELPVAGTVTAVPGPALERLLDEPAALTVTASSRGTDDPLGRPGNLVDGDDSSGWTASGSDDLPTVDLSWKGARRITSVRLLHDLAFPASAPVVVAVTTPSATTTVHVPDDGVVTIPPSVTDHLTVQVLQAEARASYEPDGRISRLPTGLTEIRLNGAPNAALPPAVEVPCGSGPDVDVDGSSHPTAVTGTRPDLAGGRPLDLRLCDGPLSLTAGEHRVIASETDALQVQGLSLGDLRAATAAPREMTVKHWGTEHRTVEVAAGEQSYLVVHENSNTGWRATLGGRPLAATRIDGWQQAWVVPAGAGGTVRLDFAPGRTYHEALVIGAILVLLLLALALLPSRVLLPVPKPARDPWRLAVVVGAAVLVLIGGLTGAVVFAVLLLGQRFLKLPALAATAYVLAGVLTAAAPWAGSRAPGAFSRPVQLLALVTVAAVAATVSARRSPTDASGGAPGAPPVES